MIMPLLAVKNIATSIAFYRDKLGWEVSADMKDQDGNTFFGIVNLGEATFGLGTPPDAMPAAPGAGVEFMVYVPDEQDIDTYYADVQGRGTAIAKPIEDNYWGDRTFTVHDPDGYVIIVSKTTKPMSVEDIEAQVKQRGG